MKNSYNPNNKAFRTIVLSGDIDESSVKDAIQTISFIKNIKIIQKALRISSLAVD